MQGPSGPCSPNVKVMTENSTPKKPRRKRRTKAQIEAEKDRYLDIFRRHNLDKLALAKPGLIESRINKATASVFEEIENDSKNIANLDGTSND